MLSTSAPTRVPFPTILLAAVVLCAVVFLPAPARADRVTLNDGTVLDGTVIKQGDNYWVKTKDGQRKVVAAVDVKTIQKGSGPAVIVNPGPGTRSSSGAGTSVPAAKPKVPSAADAKPPVASDAAGPRAGSKPAPEAPLDFADTERKANAVEAPLAAVTLWQAFVDSKPKDKQELASAKEELSKWKKLAEGGAEKIKGKWVGGVERKQIMEKAKTLNQEGWDLLKGNQTVAAVKKFEEVVQVYPNSFPANFFLGYIQLLQRKEEAAQKYFDQCLRLRPNSAETHANIGLIHLMKKRLPQAVQSMGKAAELGDTKEIAQNLVTAVSHLPPAQRRSEKLQPAIQAANLLAAKYSLSGDTGLVIVTLSGEGGNKPPAGEGPAAGLSSGTGFVIAPGGLILTNRHVVDGGKTFLVMMTDNTQKSAEVVVIDDEQDLALIRVKPDDGKTLSTVRLSPGDNPADGAECTVMGFPLIDRLGAAIKVTRGIVSSSTAGSNGAADVLIDAKVNPGNSGGPILDRHGNVMAIVSMKSLSTATEESYGMGISAGRIRKFLAKNNVKVDAGAEGAAGLSAQDIAARVKPAAVCIVATH
jgi:S1-C subfamily serine protease/TolA-binding protein